jgi:hypothetical protein
MLNFPDLLILTTVAAGLWIGHVFPWHISQDVINGHGELKRVVAYIYGTTWILLGMAAWSYLHSNWSAFLFLCLVAIAAGIGTTLPRLVERQAEYQARGEDLDDREVPHA